MRNFLIGVAIVVLLLIIVASIYFSVTPSGKATWNNWFHAVQKADDATNYKTLKEVENTCRSMIASYESDKMTYERIRIPTMKKNKVGLSRQK